MEMEAEGAEKKMFGPLLFNEAENKTVSSVAFGDEVSPCLLCDTEFVLPSQKFQFMTHLFNAHKLTLSDMSQIVDFKSYIAYWKDRFASTPMADICRRIEFSGEFSSRNCYVLGEYLQEDKQLREKLQRKKLEAILEQQQKERQDKSFSRDCLFCKIQVTGTRADYINHLSNQHNVYLGHPDNIVFTDELIDKLAQMLESLQCLYCEKTFKSREVLKEHMRKKQHKCINPNNKEYNKFYAINYLERNMSWRDIQGEESSDSWTDASDGEEDDMMIDVPVDTSGTVVCLFCNVVNACFEDALEHMDVAHEFDYSQIVEDYHLSFYEQVKLVNYIRHRMYSNCCIRCNVDFQSRQKLLRHMTEEEHFTLPKKDVWNQPEFYFPTYEDDNFLCNLDCDEGICKKLKTCSTDD